MSAQHTPGPWEKFRDSDGLFAIVSGPDTVVCRGIRNESDADFIVSHRNAAHQNPSDADLLLDFVIGGFPSAEYRDKTIYPYEGKPFQNWKIDLYLPIYEGASDTSIEASLRALLDDLRREREVKSPLTRNQIAVLEWFASRGWVAHRDWRREMTTVTGRSLLNRGLLDVDHSQTTTHYRINDAGRAAIAKATGSAS